MSFIHETVLLHECIDWLAVKPDGVYVDGTLGGAGHSQLIASKLGENGLLIGIDRDETALAAARERLAPYKDRVRLVHGNYRDMGSALKELKIEKADGVLLDLGVSSPQLDDAMRGFSYTTDAPLDMRMDQTASLTAAQAVNEWPQDELKRILYEYGEERYAPRIASAIVKAREKKRIETTLELADIIRSAMPAAALREKQHPAKRSFQAIRIAVNDELGALKDLLDDVTALLAPGGRLAIISFHSLEDRLVKTAMISKEKGCTCPPQFPVCVCGFKQTLRVLTKKPVTPSQEELERNPRSRSAKLRVAERV